MGVKKVHGATESAMNRLRAVEGEFVKAWAGDVSAAVIAKRFRLHPANLTQLAHDLGLETPIERRRRISRMRGNKIEDTQMFREMWDNENISIREMGTILGADSKTVSKYAKKFGYKQRLKSRPGRKRGDVKKISLAGVPEFYTEPVSGARAKLEQEYGLRMWLFALRDGYKARYAGWKNA